MARLEGDLELSRAFGDKRYRAKGLIADPEVWSRNLTQGKCRLEIPPLIYGTGHRQKMETLVCLHICMRRGPAAHPSLRRRIRGPSDSRAVCSCPCCRHRQSPPASVPSASTRHSSRTTGTGLTHWHPQALGVIPQTQLGDAAGRRCQVGRALPNNMAGQDVESMAWYWVK